MQDRGNPGIRRPAGISCRAVKRSLLFAALLFSLGALAFVGHAASDIMRGGRLVVTPGAPPPAVGDDVFPAAVQQMGGLVLEPGNRIEVLLDGEGTFPRLWADLRAAQRSIAFQVYYCRPGAVADTLVAILEERARAGVAVHFLADGFGCNSLVEHYGDRLRAAGARVAVFRPVGWLTLHKAQHRSHARVVVVDGRIGYTGGFGIADVWHGGRGSEPEWRETNVRVTGPAARQLAAAFAAAWAEAVGELVFLGGDHGDGGAMERDDGAEDGFEARSAGVLYGRPALGSTAAERILVTSIAGARRTLYITNSYFVPGPELRRALEDAVRRGVDVRVLTAGRRSDLPSVRYAGRAMYEELLEAGVRIYEYGPRMVHAKTFVVDGVWTAIGTLNFDNRSLRLNEEVAILAHDPLLGAAMDSIFMADLRDAHEIRLDEFRRRPWSGRLRERVVRLVWPLL